MKRDEPDRRTALRAELANAALAFAAAVADSVERAISVDGPSGEGRESSATRKRRRRPDRPTYTPDPKWEPTELDIAKAKRAARRAGINIR